MRIGVHVVLGFACCLAALAATDQLVQLRNLGKAFYENPTTQTEAVEQFRKALAIDPKSAIDRLNYGLALVRAGKVAEGIAELERVQKQDPSIPHTWFNLGVQYKKQGDAERAIPQLERMVKLVPDDAIAQYNLAASYKLAGRNPEAIRHFELAAKLDPTLAGPHFQLFNAYRVAGRKEDAARELQQFQTIKKSQEGAAIPEDMEWNMYAEVYEPMTASPRTQATQKYTTTVLPGEGVTGVAAIDYDADGVADLLAWSPKGATVYSRAAKPVSAVQGVVHWAAPGDFDNDGRTDLAVGNETGAVLYRNAGGKFTRTDINLPAGSYNAAVWIDYDHDYDLDLVLLGKQSRLMRNEGSAGFADRTPDFPFSAGEALDGVAFRVVPDTKGFDLAVAMASGETILYRDKLQGKYAPEPLSLKSAKHLQTADSDNDGVFEVRSASPSVEADFDGDGHIDIAELTASGAIERKDNHSGGSNWIGVSLSGVKNLKLARHAEVEVKAGSYYAKRMYEEIPLVFDLGARKEVDTVRITWPNGLIQNEIRQAAGRTYAYKEAQRLSGSCPMVFTWNGREFEFITDVLGVAPLGASAGDGTTFPTDHDEYIQIPGSSLVPKDGRYEIRMTEELAEVAYIDKVSLIAVDHPSKTTIVTNDKFKSPPFPEFRLFGVDRKIAPIGARQNGADVLPKVLHRDRKYADRFHRSLSAVAEQWAIEVAFPNTASDAVLVLSGWVDWADGSTFLGKSQERVPLIPPYLQVRNAQGEWQTVIEDMGMPAGKPKTIAVDLTGKFLSASREIRIVTNLAVYWDEIYLSENTAAPAVHLTRLAPEADLHFRGFSRAVIHPERLQPETFIYSDVSPVSMWNQTPGMYTRYGPVTELLKDGDDRFAIMGSGDELRLRFAAADLPPLPESWTRDFLLLVEGWAKDRDPNTAHSQTVDPLPFRSMSTYPYPATESYPDSPEQRAYRSEFNTRPALAPMRPLRPVHATRRTQ